MPSPMERDFHLKAQRAFIQFRDALGEFRKYLSKTSPPNAPEYYRARTFLREGKVLFDEVLKETKKMLGPIPAYASKEFEQWRARTLEEMRLILHGESVAALSEELKNDEFVRGVLTEEEVEAYIRDNFETQKTGKRKLAHFKARLIIDKFLGLLHEAQELQKQALAKQQLR